MTKYHLDTDMGVDDGLALALANELLPELSTLSTVFGNIPATVATRNALLFRELLGRTNTLALFEGANCASDGYYTDARHIHGEDGLGDATSSLDTKFLQKLTNMSVCKLTDAPPPKNGQVTLIGIGPATNIPKLVSWYGRSAVERIVLMSGTFFDVGNIVPYAEFNAHCDPFALQATLALGIPTTLVPLDVCRKVQLSRDAMIAFEEVEKTPLASLIVSSHMAYMNFYLEWEGIDGCFPHDSLAVLAALEPKQFFSLRGRVTVDLTPFARGKTTVELDQSSHVEIITGGKLKWAREALARRLRGNVL